MTDFDYSKAIQQRHEEKLEHGLKMILHKVNVSIIISYIAGAVAVQLPFIRYFGIVPFDFTYYLIIGSIVFVSTEIPIFFISIFEELVGHMSFYFQDLLQEYASLKNTNDNIALLIRVCFFIPVGILFIFFIHDYAKEYYYLAKNFISIIDLVFIFSYVYLIISMISQNKRYYKGINRGGFYCILIALTITLYLGHGDIEKYLVTDVILVENDIEKDIELILLDNKAIYYRNEEGYYYEILDSDTKITYRLAND